MCQNASLGYLILAKYENRAKKEKNSMNYILLRYNFHSEFIDHKIRNNYKFSKVLAHVHM